MTPYTTILNFLNEHNITRILDIGANTGEWAEQVRGNNRQTLSIEANPYCECFLKDKNLNYKICCLSDTIKTVKFYINPLFLISTGSSYYKENTIHFTENDFIEIQTNTLDALLENHTETFEYIKLDTQGTEFDIISGGINTIMACKYIQVETANIDYNIKSPHKKEIDILLCRLGFEQILKIEEHYHEGILGHEDFIYQNKKLLGNTQ